MEFQEAGIQPEPQRGVRLGVDVGRARVGVALSDPDGILATPFKTLQRDAKKNSDVSVLLKQIRERQVRWVFVGLPRTMSGGESASTRMAEEYAVLLADRLAQEGSLCTVSLLDERLTTVAAHRSLREAGVDGREHRKIVDQVAAVNILQQALDMQKRHGAAVGVPVSGRSASGDASDGGDQT
ncbi:MULTISPECIES: Holliday junction resolvase RuvX [Arthrobacter]|uniref:Putative pre-16S rRNA nuclease n=2 Tax=Arthrobacter TaxID=1663 RepID=A0ABU9KGQ6_9MICC|nr:Holliday junction resolvase RuvX [Arthrobacter sp. YJM1]MDP5226059.1 Holliday junction resolvase RuvX [Arthrobacter sp. YJM1]